MTEHTVSSWMTEWLRGADHLSPATLNSYRSMVKTHINPAVGEILLTDLTPLHVRQMLTDMKAKGKSPNTQRLTKATLRRGLREALEMELVTRNVAAFRGVGSPVHPKTGRSLTADQVRRLHDVAGESQVGALVFLLVATGLRRGEALGLTWTQVDLEHGALTVVQAAKNYNGATLIGRTKTSASRRTIALPAEVISVLRSLDRSHEYVFATRFGTPLDPSRVTREVRDHTKRVLGDPWTPHEMRHSCAPLLVSSGVPLKTVADLLGHSSITLTANVYAHLAPAAGAAAATAVSDLLRHGERFTESTRHPLHRAS